MAIEDLMHKGSRKGLTIKKIKIPGRLADDLREIRETLAHKLGVRKSLSDILLELADEGAKAFRSGQTEVAATNTAGEHDPQV